MPPRARQSRNWCFTDFTLKTFEDEESRNPFRYVCYGVETCPRSGRKHHQGFLQTRTAKSLRTVKKLLKLPSVHLEMAKGTTKEAVDYCKKDGDFHEFGAAKTQGQRKDIDEIRTLIVEGKSPIAVAEANFQVYLQYNRGLEKYRSMVIKKKTAAFRLVQVILIRGRTGTGKTRYAMDLPRVPFKIQGHSLQWWDGYDQETSLLIDEYANDVKVTKLLTITDGYQFPLPTKGGFTYPNWTTVFITTNLQQLHAGAILEHREALDRRITTTLTLPLV